MTLMMGSEVAGFNVTLRGLSLVFSPVTCSCAGRFSRRTVLVSGWVYGVFSAGNPHPTPKKSEKPLPSSGRRLRAPCASGNGDYTSVLIARGFGKLSRRRPWRLTG